jgi:hypothetical protein
MVIGDPGVAVAVHVAEAHAGADRVAQRLAAVGVDAQTVVQPYAVALKAEIGDPGGV